MKPIPQAKKLMELLQKYKLVFLVLAVGLILLLWPSGKADSSAEPDSPAQTEEFSVTQLESKLEDVLSKIDGAGNVAVALTVKSGMERVYATDESYSENNGSLEEQSETVVVSTGSGTEEVVLVQQRYPVFQGAVGVCGGGGDAVVRLLVTQAVSALTGLGTDRITVCKSK